MRLPALPSLATLKAQAWPQVRAQADRWFLWSPVAFGCGCGAYFGLGREPALWAGVVATVIALALMAVVRRRAMARAVVIATSLLAFGAAGFLGAELRTLSVDAPIIQGRVQGAVEGWVVDVAGPGSGGGRLLIAPYAIEGVPAAQLPARLRVTVGPNGLVGPGEAIHLVALLSPPPDPASPGAYDFARDSYFQRIGGVGFSLSEPIIVQGPRPGGWLKLQMAVNAARWSLATRMIEDMGVLSGGVAVAMTTGHEAWLDPDQVTSMRNAGLTHILSISGVHMAIVGGFVFVLLRWMIAAWPWLALRAPGKKIAAAGALIAIAVYLVVSGAPAPAVRSAVTLSVAFVAILVDRRAITLHALAVAALIVLALQPEAVVQPGFQMSFAATAALIALAEVWPHPVREIKVPWPIRLIQRAGGWLAAVIAASFVAGLATEPFAIQHFNRVSIYGLPANLLMEPLSSLLIMPALAIGALTEALGLGGAVLHIANLGIRLLLGLSRFVSSWPNAVWTVASAPAMALPISFLGIVGLCLWKGWLRWLALPAAATVMLWPRPAPPAAWIASDGGAAAIAVHGQAIFLRPGIKQFASDLWARRRGLQEAQDGQALQSAHYTCNRRRCLPTAPDGPRLAVLWSRRAPREQDWADLCAASDIVVVRTQAIPPAECARARVITSADLNHGGSAEIYRAGDGWRFVWANSLRGQRPWTVRQPADD